MQCLYFPCDWVGYHTAILRPALRQVSAEELAANFDEALVPQFSPPQQVALELMQQALHPHPVRHSTASARLTIVCLLLAGKLRHWREGCTLLALTDCGKLLAGKPRVGVAAG